MIQLKDATLLAVTKLRTRRIRTLTTVIISGLLFAGLITALIVAQGANDSIHNFSKEGFNNRYIVKAEVDPPLTYSVLTSKAIQDSAKRIYQQTVADKKAEAKKLSISYDPATEQQPVNTSPGDTQLPTMLNFQSPAATQALGDYFQAHPSPGLTQLKQAASSYKPIGYYMVQNSGLAGTFATMQGGNEDFTASNQTSGSQQKDILNSGVEEAAPQLTEPFILPNLPKQTNQDAIPIVMPYAKASQLLGLAPLPKGASPTQQLNRIKELYAKAGSITFAGCYRNNVSGQQIQTAISQAANITENQGNKDYHKPNLIYGLPASNSCGQATILSDTRTASEKKADANQDTFNQMFGQTIDPAQQKLTFRVVGLTPDQNAGSSTTIGGLLQNLVDSTLDGTVVIPSNMLDALPDAASIKSILFPKQTFQYGFSLTAYYVELSSASNARDFINDKSCTTRSDGTCATPTKPFLLNAFGSNSIALNDLQQEFDRFFGLAAIAVSVIAVIIMAGTVGRMVADGRRETAVFRAIGAGRLDITLIYGIYTLTLSVFIAIVSLVAGVIIAQAANAHYWLAATVQAQLLYGAKDSLLKFTLLGYDPKIWIICLVAMATGLLSMILPLVRNARRSPIKDMRDE